MPTATELVREAMARGATFELQPEKQNIHIENLPADLDEPFDTVRYGDLVAVIQEWQVPSLDVVRIAESFLTQPPKPKRKPRKRNP